MNHQAKDLSEAVVLVAKSLNLTSEYVQENELCIEIEAETEVYDSDFQNYYDAGKKIVDQGTPVGFESPRTYSKGDDLSKLDWEFSVYRNIYYAG